MLVDYFFKADNQNPNVELTVLHVIKTKPFMNKTEPKKTSTPKRKSCPYARQPFFIIINPKPQSLLM